MLILSVLQPHPKRVLVIGLSIGTWLTLLTAFPGVEKIDVVEINPGYLQAIKAYPSQQAALDDPRVHVYFDDGRRWLRGHLHDQFDLIVVNTTYHWRAYASNLLSNEFFTLIKQHMNQNAIFAFNTTHSFDAFKTATHVFPHAYLYENFVIAADHDWRPALQTTFAETQLAAMQLAGHHLFPPHSETVIRRYLQEKVSTLQPLQILFGKLLHRPFEVVTDNNLITEYKYGRHLVP